jgi:hypothetical protein
VSEIIEKPTPWRVVFRKFGMTQAELAREIGVDRSKISVALKDEDGLINARDQLKLMKAARRAGVPLKAADLLPVVP